MCVRVCMCVCVCERVCVCVCVCELDMNSEPLAFKPRFHLNIIEFSSDFLLGIRRENLAISEDVT